MFIAAGAKLYNGAHVGTGAEIRISGVLHVNSRLVAQATVPIGWVAVGDPAEIFPPNAHQEIWAIQERLNFPETVFGLKRPESGGTLMPELTERYGRALRKHREDRLLE